MNGTVELWDLESKRSSSDAADVGRCLIGDAVTQASDNALRIVQWEVTATELHVSERECQDKQVAAQGSIDDESKDPPTRLTINVRSTNASTESSRSTVRPYQEATPASIA